MNEILTYKVLQAAIDAGVRDWVLCPGSRNSSFVEALRVEERLNTYYFPEERSAAFFALGRSRLLHQPVAVVTTSGTAAAELLPAVMEAFYSGTPLIVITADRPKSFRGTGAPQSAEQVGLYSHYAATIDITGNIPCDLSHWKGRSPLHINICLEEPQGQPPFTHKTLLINAPKAPSKHGNITKANDLIDRFFSQVTNPIAIVSTLDIHARESVMQWLLKLQIPVMLEGVSGLREDPRLESLRIYRTDGIFAQAEANGYPIDGVLRIGGIPTHRIWRDLEYLPDSVKVCGISENHFSGISWTRAVACVSIPEYLAEHQPTKQFSPKASARWLENEREYDTILRELFEEEPAAETSLLASLSKVIPSNGRLYLGNSLPIREWDLTATREIPHADVFANRGVNGIDGQISTFLGLCKEQSENWAIIGDLTALYDMAGYWIVKQLEHVSFNVVIVNNGGGMIFKRMYKHAEMQNNHNLSFEPLAKMWGLNYECWDREIKEANSAALTKRIIELIPDPEASQRFWDKISKRTQTTPRLSERTVNR
jgi:2-succinyl-5-enolpyruvyl-6-hydroxy-3-cyclohexene-1-carboxylate synthase